MFNILGYGYGGSGAQFLLPDYRGYALVGADNMGAGSAGRSSTSGPTASPARSNHTLSQAEMPSHTHGDYGHGHGVNDPQHYHTIPNSALGSGVNIQPGPGWNLVDTEATSYAATGISIQVGYANLRALRLERGAQQRAAVNKP